MKKFLLSLLIVSSMILSSSLSAYASSYEKTPASYLARVYDNITQFIMDLENSTTNLAVNTIEQTDRIVDSLFGIPVKYNSSSSGSSSSKAFNSTDSYTTTIYNDNSSTDYHKVIKYTNNNTYDVYNPVTNTYNTTTNLKYDPTYNTYSYNIVEDNSTTNYYIKEGDTYISYIIEYPSHPKDNLYFEVYYELPDGRNSYNLSIDDIKGQYFIYDVVNYDVVPEDDGITLGLWHLDGDLKNYAANGGNVGVSKTSSYSDQGYFSGGKILSTNFDPYFLDDHRYTKDYVDLFFNGSLGSSYTLEFIYYGTPTINSDNTYARVFNAVLSNTYAHYAFVQDGDNFSVYINGVYDSSYTKLLSNFWYMNNGSTVHFDGNILDFIIHDNKVSFAECCYLGGSSSNEHFIVSGILDEVRLSNCALYSGNFAFPSQPFSTNTAFATPSNVDYDHTIAVQSNYEVSSFRVGGVRPTFPSNGFVYVSITEDKKIDSVQQYQESGWYEVDSTVYDQDSNKWVSSLGFDLETCQITSVDYDNSGSGSSGSGSSGSGSSGSESENDSDHSGLFSFIKSIFGFVGEVIDMIFGGLGSLLTTITSTLTSLLSTVGNFTSFLSALFPFIPEMVINAISLAIPIVLLTAIIKIIRG